MVPNDESGEVKTWPPKTSSERCSGSHSATGSVGDFEDMTEKGTSFDSAGSFVRLEQSSFGNRDAPLKPQAITRRDTLKSDSESLFSQRDEGFESASLSSDLNLSSSQRSSMCDYDTPIVVSALDGGGIRDLDENNYDASGIRCVSDNSRGSSQDTDTGLDPDIGLSGMRQAESRSSVENYFAHSSIDSLVTMTMQETVKCAEFDDCVVTDIIPLMSPRLEEHSCDDDRGSGSSSGAGEGRSSSERSSPSVVVSTKGTGRSQLRKPSGIATPSPATRLKPRIPVRVSSTTSTTAVANSRWSTTQQPKTIKYSPMESLPPSRRQSVDSDAASSTVIRPIKTSTMTRTKLSTGNASRIVRKQNLKAVEPLQQLTRGVYRPNSTEHFVRSSVPRAAISAPALRANKKAAAEARTQSGRATTTANSFVTGQLPQQYDAKVATAGSLSSSTASDAKEEIAASKPTSKLPSRTQVSKATVSRIQPPGGSRIPPPSKLQLR